MATIDDWILQSTGSFLTEDPIADESTYAPELERQYTAITGIDPRSNEVQDFKEGGYEAWMAKGLGEVQYQGSDPSQYFKALGTKENLEKFGFTAPQVTHEQLVARDLTGEYNQYVSGVGAGDAQARTDAISSIRSEWLTVKDSSSGSQAFLDRYGLAAMPYTNDLWASDDQLATAGGYAPTTPQTQDDYFGGKFGRDFTEEQIEGALTNRYGDVQPGQDMGKGWEELYQSMDKWRQQDQMWYESATGELGDKFPKAIAAQKARMAAGGMKAGTTLWNESINRINKQRLDVEGVYEQKQTALKESQTYQALQRQYDEMKSTPEIRGLETTRTRFENEVISHPATSKYQGAKYGRDYETGEQYQISPGQWIETPGYDEVVQTPYEEQYLKETETGELQFGTDGGTPSFDEFWEQNFSGAIGVENPYENREMSNQPESAEDRQARLSASGMRME